MRYLTYVTANYNIMPHLQSSSHTCPRREMHKVATLHPSYVQIMCGLKMHYNKVWAKQATKKSSAKQPMDGREQVVASAARDAASTVPLGPHRTDWYQLWDWRIRTWPSSLSCHFGPFEIYTCSYTSLCCFLRLVFMRVHHDASSFAPKYGFQFQQYLEKDVANASISIWCNNCW